ncbi:adenylate/guanylate cyclase domain-containing protein [Acidobacteriota bacterium]
MRFRKSIFVGAAEERLENLIKERLSPGADKDEIDGRIWDLFGEEWCIMFTDLSGFSRKSAQFGIIHFLQAIYESEVLLAPVLDKYGGILLQAVGDSFLIMFRNVDKAIIASIEINRVLRDHNKDRPEEEKVLICIGLGFGRVLRLADTQVFGKEVNFAGKLGEDFARAGEILVTHAVKEHAGQVPGISFRPIDRIPSGADKAYSIIYKID